ncbi:cobalamin biosynthesis protein CbiX [Mycetocola manganoxydans]|uniref:Cobalamin biosynthesis protein CbiX n=1 Tax=Mycetocola manganoxydans TaxID=699879 RepID=A0A3L6ZXC8_9MICO|nr:cobalamin biosynthesis protein CbiX [Mycetocola manganoxydans]
MAPPRTATRAALVAISHGTSSPAGQSAVARLVAATAESLGSTTVEGGFVDVQQPDVPATLGRLPPEQPAVVVPLLLSAGFHVHVDLVDAAAESECVAVIAPALGPDDRLVTLLARRLYDAGLRETDAVVLCAAGSTDARAVADCRETAGRLSTVLNREVTVGFISAASPPIETAVSSAKAANPAGRVVVSTYLLAPGYFADLAHQTSADLATAPLLTEFGEVPDELVSIVRDRYLDILAGPDSVPAGGEHRIGRR